MQYVPLWKRIYHKRAKFALKESKPSPCKVDPFSKGRRTQFDRGTSPLWHLFPLMNTAWNIHLLGADDYSCHQSFLCRSHFLDVRIKVCKNSKLDQHDGLLVTETSNRYVYLMHNFSHKFYNALVLQYSDMMYVEQGFVFMPLQRESRFQDSARMVCKIATRQLFWHFLSSIFWNSYK